MEQMTLGEVWTFSANNQYSWLLPAIQQGGVLTILLPWLIKTVWLRRVMQVIVFFGFCQTATIASQTEIREQWRIRYDWADAQGKN